MNRPLKVVDKFADSKTTQEKNLSNVVPISADSGVLLGNTAGLIPALPLGDYKFDANTRDSKLLDYLLIGVLSIVVHTVAVDVLKDMPLSKEDLVKPVKPPSKVQITFVQPKPKPVIPPPIVQRPPPPPPPPKLAPKPIPRPVQSVPNIKPSPVKSYETPVSTPSPVIAPPPKPKPAVVEKVTQPSAGAGYLDNPEPAYPEIAEERGWEGKVLMKVHVMASGKPDSVSVIKSSGHDVLDNEAVRTVKKWSFVPAKRGTTPVDGWVNVPISFNLAN